MKLIYTYLFVLFFFHCSSFSQTAQLDSLPVIYIPGIMGSPMYNDLNDDNKLTWNEKAWIGTEFGSMHTIIEDSLGYQLDQEHYRRFKESVDKAYLILYIADNAGEIVFDRILIEQLLQIKKLKIVFAVREKPIINDATLDDAIQVGLNKLATIISNGSGAPATILSQCSPEMLSYYRAADLIVAKGQGNYESLSDRSENIFFLLKVKCPVIARDSGYDIDSPVLISSTALKNGIGTG